MKQKERERIRKELMNIRNMIESAIDNLDESL